MNKYKTLDVGCGNEIRGDVGIDLYVSPEERKKLHVGKSQIYLKPHSPIIKATSEVLPFKNQTFEETICYSTLEHFLNPYLVLLEIHRVLRQNGKLIIYIPNAETQPYRHNTDHFYCWSKYELGNLLSHAGFIVETIKLYLEINIVVVARKQ